VRVRRGERDGEQGRERASGEVDGLGVERVVEGLAEVDGGRRGGGRGGRGRRRGALRPIPRGARDRLGARGWWGRRGLGRVEGRAGDGASARWIGRSDEGERGDGGGARGVQRAGAGEGDDGAAGGLGAQLLEGGGARGLPWVGVVVELGQARGRARRGRADVARGRGGGGLPEADRGHLRRGVQLVDLVDLLDGRVGDVGDLRDDEVVEVGPLDREVGHLEAREGTERGDRLALLEGEAAAEDERREQVVHVDRERVRDELDRGGGLAAAVGAVAHGRAAHGGQAGVDAGQLGVHALDEEPLVAAEGVDLLVGWGRAEIAVGEAVREGDRRAVHERRARDEATARGPGARDGAEARGSRGVARVDDVGQPRIAGRGADADGVVVDAGAAEGAVVRDGQALEGEGGGVLALAITEHVERLVEHPAVAEDREAHGHRADALAARGAGVTADEHVRAGQVGRELAGLEHAAAGGRELVLLHDGRGLREIHRPLVHEAERGLEDEREAVLRACMPVQTGDRDGRQRDDVERRAGGHRVLGGGGARILHERNREPRTCGLPPPRWGL
jgi:hypothetical protein